MLTSQVTNRVLDIKVRAIDQIERARTTVSRVVSGEETRSLDSSLQLARNTPDVEKPTRFGGWPRQWSMRVMVPGDEARAASTAGPSIRCPTRCAASSRPGRPPTSTPVRVEEFLRAGPDHRDSDVVAGGQPGLYLIFPLASEQATITLVRGTSHRRLVLLVLLAGITLPVSRSVGGAGAVGVADHERSPGTSVERMPVRGGDDMAGWRCRSTTLAGNLSTGAQLEEFGNLQPVHLRRQPRTAYAADHGADGGRRYDHSADLDPTLRRPS